MARWKNRKGHSGTAVVRLPARLGTAAIEYALILALVIASVIVAGSFLGRDLSSPFQRLTGGHKEVAQSGAGARPTNVADEPRPDDWSGRAVALAISLSLFALCCMTYSLLQRRKERQESAEDVVAPPVGGDRRLFEKRQQMLRRMEHNVAALMEGKLEVRHLMSTSLTTVTESTSAEEIHELMRKKRMRHMLVCDSQKTLQGVISIRDVVAHKGQTAGQIMTKKFLWVPPDAHISPVATMLIEHSISSLPVIDDGMLCGIVTTTDLIMALQCALQVVLKMSNVAAAVAADDLG